MKFQWSLIPKLTFIFVTFATGLLISVSALAYYSGRVALESATTAELVSTAVEKEAALRAWFKDQQLKMTALAASPNLNAKVAALAAAEPGSAAASSAHGRLVQELRDWVDPGQQYLALLVIEPETGRVLAATNPAEEGQLHADQPYFSKGREGPYVTNVYYSPVLNAPAVTAAAPLRLTDGRRVAVLAGRLNLEELNTIISRRTGLHQTDDALVVNASSIFVTQPRFLPDPVVLKQGADTLPIRRCLTRTSGVISANDYRDVPVMAAYRWLPEHELCLIVKLEQAEALAPIRAFGWTILLVGGLALAAASALGVMLARTITRPILALQVGAVRLSQGERQVRLPETAGDELGHLAREFNTMAATLAEQETQLRRYTDELEGRVRERTAALQASEQQVRRKLESILSPEGDMSELALTDILDMQAIQSLMDDFYRLVPITMALLDLKGNILVVVGWQPICINFHRVHPETCQHCLESDTQLSQGVEPGQFKLYKCKNNMWDMATPIMVGGQHVGNLFSGQFFFDDEPLDIELFRTQVRQYGFDEAAYMATLERVPRLSRETVERAVTFLAKLAQMISLLNYSNIRLARSLHERETLTDSLRQSEERYRSLFENNHSVMLLIDPKSGDIINANPAACAFYGYSQAELTGLKISDINQLSRDEVFAEMERAKQEQRHQFFFRHRLAGGEVRDVEVYSGPIEFQGKKLLYSIVHDITERRQVAEALRNSEQRLRAVFDHAGVGIVEVGTEASRFIAANDRVLEILDYRRDELLAMTVHDLTVPEDRDHSDAMNMALYQGELDRFTYEKRYLKRDGSPVWVNVTVSAVRDLGGEYLRSITTIEDISERKQAEQALQQSNERFAKAFRSSPYALIISRLVDGLIIEVNDSWQTVSGYSRAEAIGQTSLTLTMFVNPADRQSAVTRLQQQGFVRDFELEIRRKSGEVRQASLSAEMIEIDQEVCILTIMNDITERKQAEQALRLSEERFAKAFRASPAGLIISRLSDGQLIEFNQSWQAFFGYSTEELAGQNARSLNLYKDPADRQHFVAQVQAHGFVRDFEIEMRRKSGELFWISASTEMIEIGHELCLLSIVNDITERKQVEAALRESEDKFKYIFDYSILGKSITFLSGEMHMNRAFCDLFGYLPEELQQRRWQDITHPDDIELSQRMIESLLSGEKEGVRFLKRYLHKNGSVIWTDVSTFLRRGQSGQPLYFMTTVSDITERKRAEETIRQLNQELEQRVVERTAQLEATNKELEAFAYSVSHDLRAPLRGIDGFSQALLEDYADKLDDAGQSYLRRVRAASQRMGHLIDDMLALSRLTRSDMRRERVNLSELAQVVAEELRQAEPDRQIELIIAGDIAAQADAQLIQVVLENLFGNAWKFTAKHRSARIEFGTIIHNGRPVYLVRDDGAGFDMAYADKLFGPFQRLHTTAEFAGTGIGLATVQRIIHRHGGEVWAESAVEQGATFYFTL